MRDKYIAWLDELSKDSGKIAGGKGANLGEMYNAKFPVPPAFIITTKAYEHFIDKTNLKNKINEILESIDVNNTSELNEKSKQIRDLIINSEVPEELKEEIIESYENLSTDKDALQAASKDALSILKHSQEPAFVAVRSSAITEDLEGSSFAGQQETYLNVKGNLDLIKNVKKVLASLFTARAIYYRKKRGFSNEKLSLAVIVQRMINAEKSGVVFSKNPIGSNDNILVEAVFGLGEGIVSGKINPDTYQISKELEIINRKIGDKKTAVTRNSSGENKQVKLSLEKSKEQVLTTGEIKSLSEKAVKIEQHYQKPQDIEFAIEGEEIYITQSRPITTKHVEETQESKGEEILSGLAASPGISSGKVKIVNNAEELSKVEEGDILVTKMTNPEMVVSMEKCAGIITDEGGVTSHASIVSREMGIPAVVGTSNATQLLKENQLVTINGNQGKIYSGQSIEEKAEILPIVETKTQIKVVVDIPESAERASKTNCSSVGLLRLEGIISSGRKHPLQYLKENNLEAYISNLESGVDKILKHFSEIWIRTSDLRTDEFPNLDGSPNKEGNPMLGNHGIRFSLKNSKILEAEFTVVKNLSNKNPGKTIGIMMPQIISVDEIKKAKEIANNINLFENKNVKFGIMVETPAACFVIKHLLKEGLDFISLGTNDLTQYTLAVDRNNSSVQELFNEEHPAILNAIKRVLRTCQEEGVESSICGQAGSKKSMVKFLIENGINSITVNSDSANEISKYISELESNQDNTEKTNNKPEEKQDEKKEKKPAEKKELDPKIKASEVIKKAERAIAAEVISSKHNSNKTNEIKPFSSNPNPKNNTNQNEKRVPVEKAKKPDIPKYVAGTINAMLDVNPQIEVYDEPKNNDEQALKSLFGDTPIENNLNNSNTEESNEDEVSNYF